MTPPAATAPAPAPAFDLAAGATQAGLDATAAALHAVPAARRRLFAGRVTETVPVLGAVVVEYDVTEPPTFALAPPTAAQWQAAHKLDPDAPRPTADALQLVFGAVTGSLAIETAPPVLAAGALTVIAVLDLAGGRATLAPVAVALDETGFTPWDQVIVNEILIPQALAMATAILSVSLPPLPALLGLRFQPLTAAIAGGCVVAGTALVGGDAPSLAGFTAPGPDLFALARLGPVNQVLASQVAGRTFATEGRRGPRAWYAAARLQAADVELALATASGQLQASASAEVSGYGELGGTGVGIVHAALCPVGAAVDAIADPGNWDKVISSFDLRYRPDPLIVPVALEAGPVGAAGQPVRLSVGALDPAPRLLYRPTWSGSVTGTALSAAATAFIDLVSVVFGKLIVERIVDNNGQHRTIFTIPPLAHTIAGVTATLAIAAQPVTASDPQTLCQALELAFA